MYSYSLTTASERVQVNTKTKTSRIIRWFEGARDDLKGRAPEKTVPGDTEYHEEPDEQREASSEDFEDFDVTLPGGSRFSEESKA